MTRYLNFLLLILISLNAADPLAAPRVVSSIAPIHSLLAGVLDGVAQPKLLVRGGVSPHSYRLMPSQLRAVHHADLLVLVGSDEIEGFLTPVLASLDSGVAVLRLTAVPGMHLLAPRTGGLLPARQPKDSDYHGVDNHMGGVDSHIWLDPGNARRMVQAMAQKLAEIDPKNRLVYQHNAQRIKARIQDLDGELTTLLAPVHDRPVIVFHDAYQYLEAYYDLHIVASVSVDPARRPGARRLHDIHRLIETRQAVCLFSEPEFPDRMLRQLSGGIRHAFLDPLGSEFTPGADLYFQLMRRLAVNMRACLS